ncbi:MAG: hypothetical protein QM490_02205 [Candidatus Gracilibacteria bacterium]
MVFCSKLFEYVFKELISIEDDIDWFNSIVLPIDQDKIVQRAKKHKLLLKEIISEEINRYLDNPTKWVSENHTDTSEEAAPFLIDFLLNQNTGEIQPEKVRVEILPEIYEDLRLI